MYVLYVFMLVPNYGSVEGSEVFYKRMKSGSALTSKARKGYRVPKHIMNIASL